MESLVSDKMFYKTLSNGQGILKTLDFGQIEFLTQPQISIKIKFNLDGGKMYDKTGFYV